MYNIYYNPRTGYWYIRGSKIEFITEEEAIEYYEENER